jgi:uncharacterized protein YbbK (DUF523 family)
MAIVAIPAIMAIQKPRIGVSACLLGEQVRYDGGHKRNATLIELIGPQVELVPVCPEVEIGMGTPREPVELVPGERGFHMVTVTTRIDYTDRMNEWAGTRVRELERGGIDGYVLKSGSPSCGLDVPVLSERSESGGSGLFASTLMSLLPSLPVLDEKQLEDPRTRAEFMKRVLAHHRKRTE